LLPMRRLVFLLAVIGLGAGCGETISLGTIEPDAGTTTSTSGTGGGSASCDGKACGTPCPLADQPDFGYCDGLGVCQSVYLCTPYEPCKGLVCGDLCKPCDPRLDDPCPLPPDSYYACNDSGACTAEGFACPPCK